MNNLRCFIDSQDTVSYVVFVLTNLDSVPDKIDYIVEVNNGNGVTGRIPLNGVNKPTTTCTSYNGALNLQVMSHSHFPFHTKNALGLPIK